MFNCDEIKKSGYDFTCPICETTTRFNDKQKLSRKYCSLKCSTEGRNQSRDLTPTMSKEAFRNSKIRNDAYFCVECNLSEWNSKPISLHVDHIDGNNKNNKVDNLRLLCPNCHSQTDTYCGNNNKIKYHTTNFKVKDEDLLVSMKTEKNPSDALKAVGLAGAGNYKRVYALAEKHNISHMKQQKTKQEYSFECKLCNTKVSVRNKREIGVTCSDKCRKEYQASKSPLYEISNEEIVLKLEELGNNYVQTGKFFGVSDNAIRKKLNRR